MLLEMLGRKRLKKGRIRMELFGSSVYECVWSKILYRYFVMSCCFISYDFSL